MRLLPAFLAVLVLLAAAVPALAEKPDPSVKLELLSPEAKSAYLPNGSVRVEVRVEDPFVLVRRVFVRLGNDRGQELIAHQEAQKRGDRWVQDVVVPGSLAPGTYLVNVVAVGDGGVRLRWDTRPITVDAAKFALKVISPGPSANFHRNEAFDVVAQVDDPRKKARRVFVYFEEPATKRVLNGDRDAQKRGSMWTSRLHVPATATPGHYQITVEVLGEGLERLAVQQVPVSIDMAPVVLRAIDVQPTSPIHPGDAVSFKAAVDDPRAVVRRVTVTVFGPDGVVLRDRVAATRSAAGWTLTHTLDEDAPQGTYRVEYQALGQGDQVLSTTQAVFPVNRR